MRSCPVCQTARGDILENNYAGSKYELYGCVACGFRYVDSKDLSQSVLDKYYLEVYKTDDKPYSDKRLNSLAACVASNSMRVLDIGGMDGELQSRLNKLGVLCDVSGVGDSAVGRYDGVILSHTLEHIYDLKAMFDRVKANLIQGALLYIEVPIHSNPYLPPKEYDAHFQHINKFRVTDLIALIRKYDFEIVESIKLPDYREYNCWRVVAQYAKI